MHENTEEYNRNEVVKAFTLSAINAIITCITTFLLVNLLYNLLWYGAANHYINTPKLEYNGVSFLQNLGWYPRAVKNIYTSSPALCAVLFLVFFALFYATPRNKINYRMFMLFASINSFAMLLTQWLAMPYVKFSGLGVWSTYLYWSERDRFLSALIALIVAIFYSRFLTHYFIQLTPNMKFMKRSNYQVFSLYVIVLPFVTTAAIAVVLKLIENWYTLLAFATASVLFAVTSYLRVGERKFKVIFLEGKVNQTLAVPTIVLLTILVAIYIYLAVNGFIWERYFPNPEAPLPPNA